MRREPYYLSSTNRAPTGAVCVGSCMRNYKTYSQHICNQSKAILSIVGKAFVVVVKRLKRFASIRIDISVECRTNVDKEYTFKGK